MRGLADKSCSRDKVCEGARGSLNQTYPPERIKKACLDIVVCSTHPINLQHTNIEQNHCRVTTLDITLYTKTQGFKPKDKSETNIEKYQTFLARFKEILRVCLVSPNSLTTSNTANFSSSPRRCARSYSSHLCWRN